MNEPKRRGRPPKAKVEGADVETCAVTVAEDAFLHRAAVEASVKVADGILVSQAQAYALRVWNGQSPDVPRNERLRRVAKALEGQCLSMEGVELP